MSGLLTHTPQHIVRQLLVDLSLGSDPDTAGSWKVYDGSEPDTPDACITVYGTDPDIQGSNMIDGEVTEQFGFQVRVRSVTEALGWAKIQAVANALDKTVRLTTVTVSSSQYLVYVVTRTSGPIPLGKEPSSKRYLFTLNAKACIRQLS